jgi:two-component system, OmpR family, sensor kinase
MSGRWTVRRLLAVVLSISAVVMLLVGFIGAFAVHESTETVDHLSRELAPAQVANAEFMTSMLDAETELRAYLISGESKQLADHRVALARVPKVEAALEGYARSHPALAELVATQDARARAWIRDFVRVAIAQGPSAADDDRSLFDLGVRRFDAVKQINKTISDRLQDEVSAARTEAQDRLDATVALIALFALLGAVVCWVLGWRVARSIRRTLKELEDVVDRLAAGELDTRASVDGPAEIQRLSRAINELAEENARALALEQQVQDQLLEIDRVKSDFVANVSHELRTPLTSISGYLELLADDIGDSLDADHAEMVLVMRRNMVRLQTLIEDLLDLGRVEREPNQLQSVDVARLVEDVAKDLRLSAGNRDVSITVDIQDEVPAVVLADATQLQRALVNVVSNAVKFSHEGDDVRMHLGTTTQQVEVQVSDTGIGIPADDQNKVGERFFRASNAVSAHIPGTGLGLRMVQAIVSNHHGSFGLSSKEGRGTTATLRLPLQRVPDRPAGPPSGRNRWTPSSVEQEPS